MRIFTLPRKYAATLEGIVSRAVDEIRMDQAKRDRGEEPQLPDFSIDDSLPGNAFVVVGLATDSLVEGVTQACDKARDRRARRRA
jgi:hypothetical protein